jgi:hypothetical protein
MKVGNIVNDEWKRKVILELFLSMTFDVTSHDCCHF